MKRLSLTSNVTPTPLKFKKELCRERPKGTPYYFSALIMPRTSAERYHWQYAVQQLAFVLKFLACTFRRRASVSYQITYHTLRALEHSH